MLAAGVGATTDWHATTANVYASALEVQEVAGICLLYAVTSYANCRWNNCD